MRDEPVAQPTDPTTTDGSGSLRRTWCRVDVGALRHNLGELRRLTGPDVALAPVVKSNAYGHGMRLAARVFVDAGAEWLVVDSLHEAAALRDAGIEHPLHIVGHVPPEDAAVCVALGCRPVVYEPAQVDALAQAARAAEVPTPVPLQLKLETGTYRQGLELADAMQLASHIENTDGVMLEGVSSHFANVEDTIHHDVARRQLDRFDEMVGALRSAGHAVQVRTMANSAATILWPHAHLEVVRPGIAVYGMWPSRETYLSAMLVGRHEIELRPALTWCTKIVQLKDVPPGADVGYGCTFRTTTQSRIAVLPVGYYDGYDRSLSNLSHVLVRGHRAPVRGRVCMNMTMVDVTHVPDVALGDEVVLLGRQGDEEVSAETIGDWAGTINYEVTTRIIEAIPRIAVHTT